MIFSILTLIAAVAIQPHSRIEITTKDALGVINGGGSGVIIDKNKILTAYHVIKGAISATATCNDKQIELKPVISSSRLDLTVVEYSENCTIEPIVIAKENALIGSDLYALGYPSNFGLMITKGIVSSYYFDHKKVPQMWSDVKVWYGNSGGPAINTDGELVGIVLSLSSKSTVEVENKEMDVNSQQYASITPVSVIKVFLLQALAKPVK